MSIVKHISEKILHLAEHSPVFQSDLVHTLSVRHDQRISEAIKLLIDSHKITRIPIIHNVTKRKTFLIKLNGSHRAVKKDELDKFSVLLHGDVFSPCTGCRNPECAPPTCNKIMEWVR